MIRLKKTTSGGAGFTLVEALVALGVLSLVSLVLASTMFNQQKQVHAVEQKLEINDFKALLQGLYSDPAKCSCQFTAADRFNSTDISGNQFVALNQIWNGCAVTDKVLFLTQKTSSNLIVQDIRIGNMKPKPGGPATEWMADWLVTFALPAGSTGVPPKPLSIKNQIFTITTSAPFSPTSAGIASCAGAPVPGTGIAACPAGMVMVGDPSTPSAYCIDNSKQAAQLYPAAVQACYNRTYAGIGRAHLCSYGEWTTACQIGAASSMANGVKEYVAQAWTHNFGPSDTVVVLGFASGCYTEGGEQITIADKYRCCLQ